MAVIAKECHRSLIDKTRAALPCVLEKFAKKGRTVRFAQGLAPVPPNTHEVQPWQLFHVDRPELASRDGGVIQVATLLAGNPILIEWVTQIYPDGEIDFSKLADQLSTGVQTHHETPFFACIRRDRELASLDRSPELQTAMARALRNLAHGLPLLNGSKPRADFDGITHDAASGYVWVDPAMAFALIYHATLKRHGDPSLAWKIVGLELKDKFTNEQVSPAVDKNVTMILGSRAPGHRLTFHRDLAHGSRFNPWETPIVRTLTPIIAEEYYRATRPPYIRMITALDYLPGTTDTVFSYGLENIRAVALTLANEVPLEG